MPSVELPNCSIHQLLEPLAKGLHTIDRPLGIGLQPMDDGGQRFAGEDSVRHRGHPVLDSVQLVPTPPVRVRQVDGGTEKRSGPELVAFRSNGVAGCSPGRVLLAQETSGLRIRL